MKSVLVLGGGFAGLSAARRLARSGGRDVSVTLVDRSDESVMWPLLPDLVSARIRPRSMACPIRPLCDRYGIRFVRQTVRGIDPESRRAATDAQDLAADFIVIALGCVTNYFGVDEMARKAPGLKSIPEAQAIHDRVGGMIQKAKSGGPAARVVVVGGGYTGIETASHVAHLVKNRTGLPFTRIGEVCGVLVVEKGDEALRNVSDNVRAWAKMLMDGYGVEIRAKTGVKAIGDDGVVRLSDGEEIPNALTIWSAGVTPGEAIASFNPPLVRGRIAVDGHLRLRGNDRVFAAGDAAGACRPGENDPLRMGVQFSLRGGDCAGRNVLCAIRSKPLRTFDPFDPGYIIPLAPGKAAGVILGREMHGALPSALHYLMCGFRSWRWRERLAVLRDVL